MKSDLIRQAERAYGHHEARDEKLVPVLSPEEAKGRHTAEAFQRMFGRAPDQVEGDRAFIDGYELMLEDPGYEEVLPWFRLVVPHTTGWVDVPSGTTVVAVDIHSVRDLGRALYILGNHDLLARFHTYKTQKEATSDDVRSFARAVQVARVVCE